MPDTPIVRDRSDLRVVGWIQVEQREGLRFHDGIEGVALNGLDASRVRNLRSIRVEFDSIEANGSPASLVMS
jgi:hypothetical protein